jgi:hypothetical protein
LNAERVDIRGDFIEEHDGRHGSGGHHHNVCESL